MLFLSCSYQDGDVVMTPLAAVIADLSVRIKPRHNILPLLDVMLPRWVSNPRPRRGWRSNPDDRPRSTRRKRHSSETSADREQNQFAREGNGDQIASLWPGHLDRLLDHLGDDLWPRLVPAHGGHYVLILLVERLVWRGRIGQDRLRAGLGGIREMGFDAPRFDQHDLNPEGRQLQTQGIAQGLQGKLGRRVGAIHRGGQLPANRAYVDDAPSSLLPHVRGDSPDHPQ